MEISFVSPASLGAGALVLGVQEGAVFGPLTARFDEATSGALKRAVEVSRFKGQSGQAIEVLAPAGVKATRIVLAGMGKGEACDGGAAERLGATVSARLLTSGEESLAFAIDLPKRAKVTEAEMAAHVAAGAYLRSYRFDHYRKVSDDEKQTLRSVLIATKAAPAARKLWADMSAVVEGIFIARDLVNEPANVLHPEEFAKRASALKQLGVKVEVFDVPAMRKLGMNALLGVGQGSANEPRMVVMQWNGAPKATAKKKNAAGPLAIVGKGVCFDSGGLSLKPAAGMMGMKGDMGGGAAVVGLMHALAKRKARVNAVGLVGLVENMPDGKAQRPNDVVKTMSGQTIEILNTDAEGRLVLADVLWYAQSRFKPRAMVDLATLTGAIMIALGTEHAGLFSNNDELAQRILRAGAKEHEPVWRMPLGDAYERLVKSKIADMKNIGGPNAGSITAAQILQRFVNKVPWAHLDIAGVAWQDSEQKALAPSWGTGWGVRILNRLVADSYSDVRGMTETLFYHLEKRELEDVLPGLLERTRARAWKAVVCVGTAERMQTLDSHLWTYSEQSFLAHGTGADGYPSRQPIYLTTESENPNRAEVLFLVGGAVPDHWASPSLRDFSRIVLVFDGRDETALAAARAQWRNCRDAGHEATYWKESPGGKWEKQG